MGDFVLTPAAASTNWGGFLQRILDEIHRQRTTDRNAVAREACSAIDYYRSHRFWFNEGSASFVTVADQGEYAVETSLGELDGYPQDLMHLDVLRLKKTNSDWEYPLERISFNDYRERNAYSVVSGYPSHWSFHNKTLYVYPAPDTADWTFYVDYLKDIGTPVYKYVGGDWKFYERLNGEEIGDSWSSDWFTYAEPLIRARVKWALYTNMFHDMTLAASMKDQEREVLANLEGATDNYQWTSGVTPWLAGL